MADAALSPPRLQPGHPWQVMQTLLQTSRQQSYRAEEGVWLDDRDTRSRLQHSLDAAAVRRQEDGATAQRAAAGCQEQGPGRPRRQGQVATAATAIAAEIPSATTAAAAVVTAATMAATAAGSAVKLAGQSAGTVKAGSSCRPVLGQWEETARLLGLRWTTSGAQLPQQGYR